MTSQQRRVEITWQGGYHTQIDVRGVHQFSGDETPQFGGEDRGPMPSELLLSAVGTCMCLAIAHVAKKRRITLTRLWLGVDAEKDMQAFRFRDIFLHIQADLPQEQLTALVEQARRYCFVSNTLTAGCAIHYQSQSTLEAAETSSE